MSCCLCYGYRFYCSARADSQLLCMRDRLWRECCQHCVRASQPSAHGWAQIMLLGIRVEVSLCRAGVLGAAVCAGQVLAASV